MEYAMSSSPDPLNDSPTYYSPQKIRRSAKAGKIFTLERSSPTKQTFELDVGNRSSPQKLIVTVEADTTDIAFTSKSAATSSSPSRRALKTRERTTTTTVPVKGLSDSEGEAQSAITPKKSRGRPRKLNGTPVKTKPDAKVSRNRSASKTRRSIGDLVDGDDEEDVDFQVGRNVSVGRGKGRSRSRSVRSTTKAAEIITNMADTAIDEEMESSSSGNCRMRSISGAPTDEHEYSGPTSIGRSRAEQSPGDAQKSTIDSSEVHLQDTSSEPYTERAVQDLSIKEVHSESLSRFAGGRNYFTSNIEPGQDCDSEAEDVLGDLQEFDTILESEEFSMISVDSVPSLRQHFSSPLQQQQDEASMTPVPKVQQSLKATSDYNDSFSAVPDMILAAATPARQSIRDSPLGSRNNPSAKVPAHPLDAATPAFKSHVAKFQSNVSVLDDSFSSVAPEILEAATPGRIRAREPCSRSFLQPTSGNSSRFKARPLTPETTPSPGKVQESAFNAVLKSINGEDLAKQPADVNSDPQADEVFLTHSYMPSSPPVQQLGMYNAQDLHVQQIETPHMSFSSPNLPPPKSFIGPRSTAKLKSSERPILLPTARAGHALQQSIMALSSPRSRSNSLGSPFKSPPPERRSSITYPYLPSPSQEKTHHSMIGSGSNATPSKMHEERIHKLEHDNDPFQIPEQTQVYASTLEPFNPHMRPVVRNKTKITNSRFSSIKSADVSIASGSAMSWQPEQEVSIPVAIPPNTLELDVAAELQSKWDRERAAVSNTIRAADPEQVIVLNSDTSSTDPSDDNDGDDEGLQLLLETINSSSPVKAGPDHEEETIAPRRGRIPSPWRQNSKRLVYSDELQQVDSLTKPSNPMFPTSYIAKHRAEPVARPQHEDTPVLSDDALDVDLSGYKIPQKSNFKPRAKQTSSLDFAALLSPIKPLPTLPRDTFSTRADLSIRRQEQRPSSSSQEETAQGSNNKSAYAPIPQKAGFNPSPRKVTNPGLFNAPVQPHSSTASLKDDFIVPAKRLPQATDHAISSERGSSYSPNSSETRTRLPESKERQLLTNKIPRAINRAPPSDSDSSYSPFTNQALGLESIPTKRTTQEQENTPISQKDRTLKWTQNLHLATKIAQTPLPNKLASPTKSCFRTPSAVNFNQNISQSPSKNVVFVSSSPAIPSPSPEQLLSATEWSKKHWLLLDSLLIAHQPAKEGEVLVQETRRRRNSTRVISKLLGRKVTSQGAEMRFEQWHLEAVDEFREQVPGWEEKVIAMRAFALLVGAERRGLPGRS